MASIQVVRLWFEQNKILLYLISFISFWIVFSLQAQIRTFLAGKISENMLNFATIAVMWGLAVYILPIAGGIIILTFYLRSRRR